MFIFKNSLNTDVRLVREPESLNIFEKEQVEIKNQVKAKKKSDSNQIV